jgi:hypothetical protein
VLYQRPPRLLTQNQELREIGVSNWTLPAWAGRLSDGRTYNTCPSAGVCAKVCYARNGTYRFSNVLARHEANLAYVLDDLPGWQVHMTWEIQRRREFRYVRIHDAGDFFSDAYLMAWLDIARDCPRTGMYCYTKEISRFRRLVEPDPPPNFMWVYSYGGREDHLINPERDRVADVFPDDESMIAAGFVSQDASDLLAVTGPPKVGIPANNIPQFRKKMAGRTFRQWQAEQPRRRGDTPPPEPA